MGMLLSMPIFSDTDELNQVMLSLWRRISTTDKISRQLIESGLSVRFVYTEPAGTLTLDCTDGKNCVISAGDSSTKPVIEMHMKADVAHEFWMGRLNVPMALLSGKIVSKGPTARALKLLPIINSALALYPKVLASLGKKRLL